ncbi:MAG: hypothetical protein ACE5R6_06150 [Candidatus Heimdallarchaeota archaeon]
MPKIAERICPKCNTELEAWNMVCPKCGHVLLATPDPSQMEVQPIVHPEITKSHPSIFHPMKTCPKCLNSDILYNQPLKAGENSVILIVGSVATPILVDCCKRCGYVEIHLNESELKTQN